MNQLNKDYIELLFKSGVNYFQKNSPNNYYNKKNTNKSIKKNKGKILLNDIKTIDELKIFIESIDNPLKKTAKKTVIYDGNLKSELMIIGEAPGKDEDEQGKPFVGRAGELLNKMLSAINIKREDIYITNVLPWRPPNNRTPNEKEILEFLPFLQRHIEIIKPRFIFLLGTTAAKAILSTPLTLSKLRGNWYDYNTPNLKKSIQVLVSYHPAFLLRSPNYKKDAWSDLQLLQKKLSNEN